MVSKEYSLSGKIALIAGDSKYWSKYAGAALAEAGADVAIAARNTKRLEEAAEEVRHQGQKVLALPTDMTDAAQVQKMVDQVVTELGRIDILVNANDLLLAKPFLETSESEWHRIFDVNLNSVFNCCRVVGKQMIKQGKGRIINLISCMAERGVENFAAYCAAMGGVLQLTRALDIEWAKHGITVNAIGTGWMSETEQTGAPQEELLLKYIPVKRYGHPREMGQLLVYLASDTTDFFSGQFLYVDGAAMSHL
ncbi:MAG: SDR family oxidoreductase [Dehalococcoidales bacterium]|nr:MAG: SDR family oxidoreductase [Dehalococcoidales bacterium]